MLVPLVQLVAATKKRRKNVVLAAGNINLKQYIFSFDIYGITLPKVAKASTVAVAVTCVLGQMSLV